MKTIRAELLMTNVSEAAQVVRALIRFERALRRRNNVLRIGAWSRLAGAVQGCRRKLQEDAGLVLTHEQVKQLLERERKPYFSHRKCSPGFEKLDKTGKTGRGTNATKMISEDREDQVMPVPESSVKHEVKLRSMPPLDEVETKLEAAAKHKRDVGRRRKK